MRPVRCPIWTDCRLRRRRPTLDIGRMRIDKWKADGESKRQAQSNADSLQRNLTSALPALIDAVRSAPQDLSAGFKLYRNLNALYDVCESLTESAGAFGPKGDYEALARQLETVDTVRRDLGDALEQMTSSTQSELNQLRSQVRALPTDRCCCAAGGASQEGCRGRHRAGQEDRAQEKDSGHRCVQTHREHGRIASQTLIAGWATRTLKRASLRLGTFRPCLGSISAGSAAGTVGLVRMERDCRYGRRSRVTPGSSRKVVAGSESIYH